ncbi:hypothetical protein OMAG_002087 [Candidatus Omnitrophus magneticus]|uniref:Uncharacterized protein n=1 Tax=Candidatus Omnitrophus magneticus TaxID=1609969 RepID=A0A0F0CL36_9BACT|nr:hypothetical protein OMAG_002087 [Candidatus Omnitrophus magneticus]
MEYNLKHKNLIAKLFKKAGMLEEAKIVLSCDDYNCKIASAMRDAASKANVPIGATPALLDAARRYENRNCAIFKECTLSHCEGGVWCDIYNLGGSHGRIGDAFRYLGKSAYDVPLPKRRKLMLEMLDAKKRRNRAKRAKGAVKG